MTMKHGNVKVNESTLATHFWLFEYKLSEVRIPFQM